MRETPLILVVDDEPANREILETRLTANGYRVLTANNGLMALSSVKEHEPDLILMDVNMPEMDGLEACGKIIADPSLPYIPIIMVTARSDSKDVVAGLDAGAVDYLTKPVDHVALMARVRSMLRVKKLQDTVHEQAGQLAEWNRTLERRVQEQLEELERVGRLKRFLSPQLAESIISSGGEKILESHRREITVVFCDLRGFTAFSEKSEPEDLMEVLRNYHATLGEVIFRFEGTLEHFSGDGLMVFFNDPYPIPDHTHRAVRMAMAMQLQMVELGRTWREQGYRLGFSVGIDRGYATLGMIGFEGRIDYGAIGSVTNMASRLCDEANDKQILISQRVYKEVEGLVQVEPIGEKIFKGLSNPVPAFNVVGEQEAHLTTGGGGHGSSQNPK